MRRGTILLIATIAALATTACGQKYVYYDDYVNGAARSKLQASKNVWIETVDYNNDLIATELKALGFSIDASKADFVISVSDAQTRMTFTVREAKSNDIVFSKVAIFTIIPTLDDRRDFIRQNLQLFLKGA